MSSSGELWFVNWLQGCKFKAWTIWVEALGLSVETSFSLEVLGKETYTELVKNDYRAELYFKREITPMTKAHLCFQLHITPNLKQKLYILVQYCLNQSGSASYDHLRQRNDIRPWLLPDAALAGDWSDLVSNKYCFSHANAIQTYERQAEAKPSYIFVKQRSTL